MATPPNDEKGQSTYRPPRFNGQYYGWWKTRMHDFIMAKDSEIWDVISDGPFIPTKNLGDPLVAIPKTWKEFNDADRKAIKKNFRAEKILVCGIGPDEYNRRSACQSAKEILETLQTAHEGTTQVKQSKIDMLTIEYELFRMLHNESVQEMHTQFTSIINEIHSLDETIPRNKLVRKILSVLPSSWGRQVNAITKAKDLQELNFDELVSNLTTYEMKKKKDSEIREPKKEKNLVLKIENYESSGEDGDMAYLTRIFQKMVHKNGGIPKKGKPGHFIKDCPLLKQDQYKIHSNKAAKRNLVLDIRFNRKNVADNVVRQALAIWGDLSIESAEDDEPGNSSMMAVESESTEYDSSFALMAQSDDEDDDDDEKLMSLENVLIDAYHSLVNDRYVLTVELGEAEQSRDDLVIIAVDLRESIENPNKERNVLKKRIENVEQERDDLLVVVMDLKLGNPQWKGIVKGSSLQWYMDSGCSKYMIASTNDFLSLKALQGGNVSFGNDKKG
ncbi:uncharacterized protein LOC142162137 [Nicotiana tabacum]|uniref:Uncharacterized protein LOC142162137 n=1 Tax=Nicotiana tabacum TaxID=4097 RepID=A0AC58RP85_TOBAC